MAHICVSLLVIQVVLIATCSHSATSFLLPVNGNHCTATTSTCPANSKCVITKPCLWGQTCLCDTGYKQYTYYNATATYTYCVPATALVDQNCDGSVQCSGDNTYCGGGICTCLLGTTVNSGKTDCTRPAVTPLGQNCTGLLNYCGYGAQCHNTICECAPGYKKFNTTDCTHYEPGEVCTTDECDEAVCAFGTCQSGEFQCTKGMKWYSWDFDANLVDGVCVPDEDWIVGQGHYCEANVFSFVTADRLCGHDLDCDTCPEQPNIKRCLGNGAFHLVTSATSFQLVTSALALITSLFLSLSL